MSQTEGPRARVSMAIQASPQQVYDAFVEPAWLTRFWLSRASGPLQVGQTVTWDFMVEGATAQVTAQRLEPGKTIAWRWGDDIVDIALEPFDGGTAITLIDRGFAGSASDRIEAALNSTEGFSIVLCDLKTLLESGTSAGLVSAKARLIAARA